MAVVNCHSCGKAYRIPDAAPANVACPFCRVPYLSRDANQQAYVCPGWLIVHDEEAPQQIFEIKPGKNTIGRSAKTSGATIQIAFGNKQPDNYMSRVHCEINAIPKEKGKGFDLILTDLSTNGTLINARRDQKLYREIDEVYLANEYVIQMGRTKVVVFLGTHTDDIQKKAQELRTHNYHETIIHFER